MLRPFCTFGQSTSLVLLLLELPVRRISRGHPYQSVAYGVLAQKGVGLKLYYANLQ